MKLTNFKIVTSVCAALLVTTLAGHSVIAGLYSGTGSTPKLNELAMIDIAALEDPEMDELRGGFFNAGDVEISFGFESILKVDGILQTRLSLNIPKITVNPRTREVTYSSIQATSFKSGNLAEGLTVSVPGSNGETGLALARLLQSTPVIIQNTANNRTIQNFQTFDLGIKGIDPNFTPGVQGLILPSLINSIN
ncbi:MAG TPA: hypothetical protein DD827_02505 [Gammaproteobacteria bacterium]|nr:hypothetical protein [Gammaproteobacteria bacterium]